MLRAIMAELKYFKYPIIIIYGIILYLFYRTMIEDLDVNGFMLSSSILFLIAMGILGIASGAEKRDRFTAMLPLSIQSIGIQNLMLIIICKTSIFLLWIITYFTIYIRKDPGLIWTMTSFSMFNLTFVGIVMIGIDLGYYVTRFRKTIFIISLIGAMGLFNIFGDIMYSDLWINKKAIIISPEFIKTPLWALSTALLAGFILFLDFKLFINRRYYLD